MSHLGRLAPPDFEHVAKYPLTAATTPSAATPGVLGINWYTNFDRPVKERRRWWVGLGDLGSVRGGHAIATVPARVRDLPSWWGFYDQGHTGECVGFSTARMMSLLNRARYDAADLYFRAQDQGGEPRDPQAGTYCRNALEVLRTQGPKGARAKAPDPKAGIATYRWATSSAEVVAALEAPGETTYARVGGIPLANSWGRGYPHIVWVPFAVVDRLLGEGGEAGFVTDL